MCFQRGSFLVTTLLGNTAYIWNDRYRNFYLKITSGLITSLKLASSKFFNGKKLHIFTISLLKYNKTFLVFSLFFSLWLILKKKKKKLPQWWKCCQDTKWLKKELVSWPLVTLNVLLFKSYSGLDCNHKFQSNTLYLI